MIKLILGLLMAGLIAGAVYYFALYDQPTDESQQNGGQSQNALDAPEGASDAVQQQQDRAEDVQQKAQDAVSDP